MNSKRYQLLFMSVMGLVWSVYELGVRAYSYFQVLNSTSINKSEWISYTLLESSLYVLLILAGLAGLATVKKRAFWPLSMIMGALSLAANFVLLVFMNVTFNIVTIAASCMITFISFQARDVSNC